LVDLFELYDDARICQRLTVVSPFFGAFPFDSIPKTTKEVSVHYIIHSFTLRNKLIRDNALAVRTSSKLF